MEAFELVVGGSFTIGGRGVVIFGPYVGPFPDIGSELILRGHDNVVLRPTLVGIEDMWVGDRDRDDREFGLLVAGITVDQITPGDVVTGPPIP